MSAPSVPSIMSDVSTPAVLSERPREKRARNSSSVNVSSLPLGQGQQIPNAVPADAAATWFFVPMLQLPTALAQSSNHVTRESAKLYQKFVELAKRDCDKLNRWIREYNKASDSKTSGILPKSLLLKPSVQIPSFSGTATAMAAIEALCHDTSAKIFDLLLQARQAANSELRQTIENLPKLLSEEMLQLFHVFYGVENQWVAGFTESHRQHVHDELKLIATHFENNLKAFYDHNVTVRQEHEKMIFLQKERVKQLAKQQAETIPSDMAVDEMVSNAVHRSMLDSMAKLQKELDQLKASAKSLPVASSSNQNAPNDAKSKRLNRKPSRRVGLGQHAVEGGKQNQEERVISVTSPAQARKKPKNTSTSTSANTTTTGPKQMKKNRNPKRSSTIKKGFQNKNQRKGKGKGGFKP